MTVEKNSQRILSYTRDVMAGYPREQRFTLAMLQDIQKKYKYIPRESLEQLSDHLGVPLSKLYSIATFYKALSLQPKGDHVIRVCDGTACHIRSSMVIVDELAKILMIKPGETTSDGKFSLETVNCLGSCAMAPAMVIDETYYGKVTPSRTREILNEYGGVDCE
ncbi:NADH-quinone oxidoreductase subunit NuoE [Pelotomaculum propionicicum]|uniref:NADP-reducing hydrogenase subunit HndA n=1 Tax=Pelotomaculum propionicicum TaxID=258475 RepID=A0A4Y7RXC5_9FIRM|nr:NADH-quinone oxidoreductase subunit NuoE [Pelotomaculum propionicicum]TEB13332.1 NADP-reducing hydrogenase subunit HndA [Pelotomaculum propionicicum]